MPCAKTGQPWLCLWENQANLGSVSLRHFSLFSPLLVSLSIPRIYVPSVFFLFFFFIVRKEIAQVNSSIPRFEGNVFIRGLDVFEEAASDRH